MSPRPRNATQPGTISVDGSEAPSGPQAGLSLGSTVQALATSMTPYMSASPGGALSLPQALGHSLTREEQRTIERAEEQALAIHTQAGKLRVLLQEWVQVNQQVGVQTAQTFALLTTLKHLSSDPDYQAWWASWSKFEAERLANTTDDLLVVGARAMADILVQPVQPPGELVAFWRSLFAR